MLSEKFHSLRLYYVLPLMVLALTVAAYWNVTSFSFINFDDDLYIYTNAMTLRGITPESLYWSLTSLEVYNWHPLAWMSHMLDVELFGLQSGMHHMTSVIIHLLNSVLLYILFYRITKSPWKSAFVMGVFALHPMHVESVAWVSERKDVLSFFFILLALLSYARYARTREGAAYVLTLLLFCFSLMAKPIAVVFPFLLVAFDVWPLKRLLFQRQAGAHAADGAFPVIGWRKATIEKLPFFALAFAAGIVTIIAQGKGGAISSVETLGILDRIAHSTVSYVHYLGKIFYPTDLSFYYLFEGAGSAVEVVISAAVLLAVSVVAVAYVRHAPYVLSGWMMYVLALLPVIGLLQAGGQSMADRYTYIPMVGLSIIVAWGVPALCARLKTSEYVPLLLGISVILVLSAASRAQVQTWKNNNTLYRHAIAVEPRNSLAYNNLGTHYLGLDELDSARVYFRNAIQVNPKYATPAYNLALVEQLQGHESAAIPYYRKAIVLNPEYVDAYVNLGAAYSSLGKYDSAHAMFRKAVKLKPLSPIVHYHIGVLYYRTQEYGKAATHLHNSIEADPYNCEVYGAYASVLRAQGNARGADVILSQAREIGCTEKGIQRGMMEPVTIDSTKGKGE